MGWLEGILSGYGARHREIQQEKLQAAQVAAEREGKIYEALLNSPDEYVRTAAGVGLLNQAAPLRRRGGLAGWMGEMEQNPVWPVLSKYMTTPQLVTPGPTPSVAPRYAQTQLPAPLGGPPQPPLAQSPNQTTRAGSPSPTPPQPLPSPSATAPPPPAWVPTPEPGLREMPGTSIPPPGPPPGYSPLPPATPIPPEVAAQIQPAPVAPVVPGGPESQMQPLPATVPPGGVGALPPQPTPLAQPSAPPEAPTPLAQAAAPAVAEALPTAEPAYGLPRAFPSTADLLREKNRAEIQGEIAGWQEIYRQKGEPDWEQKGIDAVLARHQRSMGIHEGDARQLPDGSWVQDLYDNMGRIIRTIPAAPRGMGGTIDAREAIAFKLYGHPGENPSATIQRLQPSQMATVLQEERHQKALNTAEVTLARARAMHDAPLTAQATSQLIETLNSKWMTLQKPAREMQRQFGFMQTGLQRFNAGDEVGGAQTVLVTFQKILDPLSVVRESEYARSPSGLPLLSRMEGFYDKHFRGGGAGVPREDLAEMVETGRQLLEGMQNFNDDERQRLMDRAAQHGIDPGYIFGGGVATPTPPPQGLGPAAAQAPPTPPASATLPGATSLPWPPSAPSVAVARPTAAPPAATPAAPAALPAGKPRTVFDPTTKKWVLEWP
jgi:hypothetical protein